MNLTDDIAALTMLTVAQLRSRYAEVFGDTTRVGNKTWLVRRLAWRLQANALGDLSQRARARAAQLANDADLRLNPPAQASAGASADPSRAAPALLVAVPPDPRLPAPGTILTRLYKGQELEVTVLPTGFAFQGKVFLSLSALAKAITGAHCNGFAFFRLSRTEAGSQGEAKP